MTTDEFIEKIKNLKEGEWCGCFSSADDIITAEWHDATKEFPQEWTDVLVTDGKDILIGYLDKGKWKCSGVSGYEWDWDFDDYYSPSPITHWMELPKPPKKTGKITTPAGDICKLFDSGSCLIREGMWLTDNFIDTLIGHLVAYKQLPIPKQKPNVQ